MNKKWYIDGYKILLIFDMLSLAIPFLYYLPNGSISAIFCMSLLTFLNLLICCVAIRGEE